MRLIFSPEAWEDYVHWRQHDRKILQRIKRLINEIRRDPFTGIGKPEPLRDALTVYWSQRIDAEHHIGYCISAGDLLIAQLRHHY